MLFSVITTIASPTTSVSELSKIHKINNYGPIIIVGDQKGPVEYDLENCELLTMGKQESLYPKLSKILPKNHYARKNIGYLYALQSGASCIYETDDDNRPNCSWSMRTRTVKNPWIVNATHGWSNVYKYYTDEKIWPRGLPLNEINKAVPDLIESPGQIDAPIQQGLVNNSPDVDAIWRLVMDRPFVFDQDKKHSIVVPQNVWSPFNTQSTWWWPEAYALMYIPSYCSFRMCDIWKSFIAQRCLWEIGTGVVYHPPEVIQDRNPHNLQEDFEDEISGYLNNTKITSLLEGISLKSGPSNVLVNLRECYECLVSHQIFPDEEMPLVDAWCEQVELLVGRL